MAEALGEEPAVFPAGIPSRLQRTFRRSNLFLSLWLSQLVAVALFTPINTRLLGPGRFGRVAAAMALTQVLYAAGSLQLQRGIQRRYNLDGEDAARRLVLLAAGMAAAATSLAYLSGPLWSHALGFGRFDGAPRWAVLWAGAIALTGASLAVLMSQQRAGPFCVVTVLQSLGAQALAVAFVLGLHRTASMFVLGLLVGQCGAAIVALVYAPPRWVNRSDLDVARAALADCIPLAPQAISAVILGVSDRLIVQAKLGPVAVGRYQVADTFGSLFILVLSGLNLVWVPRVLALTDRSRKASAIAQTRNSVLKIAVPLILAVSVGGPAWLDVLAPRSFGPDGLLVTLALLSLSVLPYLGSLSYSTVLLAEGQTWTLAWAIVVAAAVNIDLNFVLVPTWHLPGAAAAGLISAGVMLGLMRWRANREWRLDRLPSATVLLLAGATAYVLLWSLAPTTTPWMVARIANIVVGVLGLILVGRNLLAGRSPLRLEGRVAAGDGTPSSPSTNGASGRPVAPPASTLSAVETDRATRGRLRRSLPAGLLDSGFSSLSSFLMGLVATHYLMPNQLGEYAVFYAAYSLASVVPATLIFTPIEVNALELPRDQRLSIVRKSVPMGALTGLISGVIVVAAVIPLAAKVGITIRLEFGVTVVVLSCLSPVQDHLRRMCHQGGRSWIAARVSIIQMVTVAALIVVARVTGLPLPIVPFGALAVGNLVSGVAGLMTSRPEPDERRVSVGLLNVIRGGGWLTFGTVFGFTAGLAAITILTDRTGAVAAGRAEAARVLSQPVTVIAIGVLAVFGPEMMSAAQRGLGARVNKMVFGFLAVVAAATVVWLVAVGIPWPWSPIRHTFSTAYVLRGLVAWTIVQQSLAYASLGYRAILIGNGRGNYVGKLDIFANVLAVVGVYVAAPRYGAFAFVWAFLAVDLLLFGVRGRMASRSVHAARDEGEN
jgi:O-antigen/teichoic acid export membrane protein